MPCCLLALKMEEGAPSQGWAWPLEAGKVKKTGFCPGASKRNAALWTHCRHLASISVR